MKGVVVRQPEFGRRLRELRVARGLSQRDLATGLVNPSYISLMESGSRVPTLEVVIQLSQVLDVPLSELLGDDLAMLSDSGQQHGARPDLLWQVLSTSFAEFGELATARERLSLTYEQVRARCHGARTIEVGLALRQTLVLLGDLEAEAELLRDLLTAAQEIDAEQIVIKLRIDLASVARQLGRLTEAREQIAAADRAIHGTELYESTEHVRLIAVAIAIRCDQGETAEVPHLVTEMLRIAALSQSAGVLGRAHWAAATASVRIGEPARAREHLAAARRGLANPSMSIGDWARFARSAASVLLDADAPVEEVDRYLASAKAAVDVLDLPKERAHLDALRARVALARGNPEQAVALARTLLDTQPVPVAGYDLVRLRRVLGRALHELGRHEEMVAELRGAAQLATELGAYRLASDIWQELDRLRS